MSKIDILEALRLSLASVKNYIDNAIAQTSIDTSGFALKTELFSKDYNDLTNKPFYETSELKLFTNDGDNTGRLIVNRGTTNGRFAKISEDVIDFNSVDQVRLSMFVGDEGVEFTDQLDPSTFTIVENETGSAISLDEYVICTFNDNFTMQMSGTGDPIVTFPEKGLYFAFNVGTGHVWRLDNVYLPIVSAKQLDEKFIPNTIARTDDIPEGFSGDYSDLTNKPFYDTREYEDVVIEYDGNNEGRTMCSLPALGLNPAYKVADLTAEQLELYSSSCANGFTLTYLKEDGSTEVVQSSIVYGFMGSSKYLYAGGGQVFLAVEPFSTEIGHADNYVNEAGVYFKENIGTDPYKVVKLEFQNVSGELKTIDAQFLTNSPGIKVEEGTSYISEYDSQTYVAQNNAEIFNNTRNMATGQCSHAEGAMTEAHGDYSHAEGYSTYAIGDYSHAEGGFAKATGMYSHAEGAYTKATGNYSHAEGYSNDAIGAYSHAEGDDNQATGECSHAEGYRTIAAGKWQHVQGVYNIEDTENKYAHIVGNGDYMYGGSGPSNAHTLDWDGNAWFAGKATVSVQPTEDNDLTTKLYVDNAIGNMTTEFLTNSPGIKVEEGTSYISQYNSQTYVAQNNAEIFNDTRNIATGKYSHAEGTMTEAHGNFSHAEGRCTYAIGYYSHAEGNNNDAIGHYSHVEGDHNQAIGDCSHAEGYKTTAAGKNQHVQGVYNIEDTENRYAHIVGNGDYMYDGSGPSNAHTLDWDGNAWFQGNVFIKGTSQDDGQKLATEEFVNNAIDNIPEGFSGNYNDLTNKPEIPSIEGLATEEFANNAVSNMLSGLRLVQMTQSEYDALEVKDSNTLYIII